MCNIDNQCEDCHDWGDDMWNRVGEYHAKLPLQWERKKERKAKAASSSSSFSGFSHSVPVPLCQLSSSYDIIVISIASSYSCAVTFASSFPLVSTAPFFPLVLKCRPNPVVNNDRSILLRLC